MTRDLFLLMLCINRRENHLTAAAVRSKSSVKFPPSRTMTLQLLVCTPNRARQEKRSTFGSGKRQPPTVAEATGETADQAAKNNFALRSADGGDRGQQFSQLGGNRCALSKRFPIMSLRERAKARRSALCCARLLFFSSSFI